MLFYTQDLNFIYILHSSYTLIKLLFSDWLEGGASLVYI